MPRARYATDADRIHRNVLIDENGCWVWRRRVNRGGYETGNRRVDGRKVTFRAHRLSYETFVGPIPEGLSIDHLCRNRRCANPEHLEAVTQRENLLRSPFTTTSHHAAKTACIHGHPFDEENTYFRRNGGRDCRACQRNKQIRRALRAASVSSKDVAA